MTSPQPLNLSVLPPVFIVPTHLESEDLHELEDALYQAAGRLTYRATEARIFLSKVLNKKRANYDLRSREVWTQEEQLPGITPPSKRQRSPQSGSSTETESEIEQIKKAETGSKRKRSSSPSPRKLPDLSNHIVVLKIEWLEACNKNNKILPFDQYLVYSAKIIDKPPQEKPPAPIGDGIKYIKAIPESQGRAPVARPSSIMERAQIEAAAMPVQSRAAPHRRKFGQKPTSPTLTQASRIPKFQRTTTSEMEGADPAKLPPLPSWMTEKHPRPTYSCLRSTPPIDQSPNRYFIKQLEKIKESRLLTLDEIGVRAYSTSIASLLAYSHRITTPVEIMRLPGCNEKLASLWIDWHESQTLSECSEPPSTNEQDEQDQDSTLDSKRAIPTVTAIETDTDLNHLRTFHDIWGVGPETARKFYLDNGWRDLDDVIEFGWQSLTRVQQIGLKFYDEFKSTIPRAEVEAIARTVLHHARLTKKIDKAHWTNDVVPDSNGANTTNPSDPRDFVAIIVGGYRRGKPASGDVDVILSHRDDRMTQDLVVDVVNSLESTGHITHTLTLHTTTSDRGQQTLPYHSPSGGHGFDSLDKALCVWQDPVFSGAKNMNVHRRVDIIVSAWRTVGCAVLGWSGGTTFQRDLRRWVTKAHGWKFDSSGVRNRVSGKVLDLESPDGDGGGVEGWEDREKRVMVKMGIGWRPATERCTG